MIGVILPVHVYKLMDQCLDKNEWDRGTYFTNSSMFDSFIGRHKERLGAYHPAFLTAYQAAKCSRRVQVLSEISNHAESSHRPSESEASSSSSQAVHGPVQPSFDGSTSDMAVGTTHTLAGDSSSASVSDQIIDFPTDAPPELDQPISSSINRFLVAVDAISLDCDVIMATSIDIHFRELAHLIRRMAVQAISLSPSPAYPATAECITSLRTCTIKLCGALEILNRVGASARWLAKEREGMMGDLMDVGKVLSMGDETGEHRIHIDAVFEYMTSA